MKSYNSLVILRGYDAHSALFGAIRNFILSLSLAVSLANGASAIPVLLFDNGPVSGDTFRCDQGPTGCAGSGTWTIYDNFNLSSPAVITAFDYTDFINLPGGPQNYVITNWSLWNSDPIAPGSPVASGSSVATLVPSGAAHLFTVGGLNQLLPAGVFWLGVNNTTINGQIVTAASASGVLPGARQSDGDTHFFSNIPERAFRIYGNSVPEPTAYVLVCAGVMAGGHLRSRTRRPSTER
jgi:hypothetical protein